MSSEQPEAPENGGESRQDLVDRMVAAANDESDDAQDAMDDFVLQGMSEEDALKDLAGTVRDQNDLERDITIQANAALVEAEDKRDQTRIDRLEASRQRLQQQLDKEKRQLEHFANNPYKSRNIQKAIDKLESEIRQISNDISDFRSRMKKRNEENPLEDQGNKSKRNPGESQYDFLVRTGKITPFSKIGGPRPAGLEGNLAQTMLDAEEDAAAKGLEVQEEGPVSHQQLRRPGFSEDVERELTPPPPSASRKEAAAAGSEFSLRPKKKQKTQRERSPSGDFKPSDEDDSDSDADRGVWQQSTEDDLVREQKRNAKSKGRKGKEARQGAIDLEKIDDGYEAMYRKRLADWVARRSRARRARRQSGTASSEAQGYTSDPEEKEWHKPAPDKPDHVIDEDIKLPGDIYSTLFGYQRTGVQWLVELYKQQVGGIVGDEMGLGKTVQLIALIAALHYSKKLRRPVLIVAPATLLRQWVAEFHRWWPPLRVSILHSSGSGMLDPEREDAYDLDTMKRGSKVTGRAGRAVQRIVDGVVNNGHVLVTTYTGLQAYADVLQPIEWEYAVLDEGHKIRNPNAEITVTCKELYTRNRIILSGTPVQNNLTELWSLFDFISPMRLGNLMEFREQFEIPIKQGGYANASNFQVVQAEQRAEILKNSISKYLLQRLKVDVAADLPEKTEQVLFCKLTDGQRRAYETFLKSDEVSAILDKRRQALYGVDILRKICNHPDLLDKSLSSKAGHQYGSPRLSAKLQLTKDLLQKVMIPNGHKALLFSQGKLMLEIIEKCIKECGIRYLRMDGDTPIDQRQPMIDQFNGNSDIHVFLMTTRTGGLGTNLTGADRIIIFDPDWNPSTDLQARERAWRLGQVRPVKIYRLMTEGTIEEKIYHRQIFKQFMTNKVLKDPKQRSSYDLSDLYDLFSFTPGDAAGGQRSALFKGAEVDIDKAGQQQEDNVNQDNEQNELQKMGGVTSMEEFKEDKSAHEEKRMLQGIFARSVGSAYDHEQIVNGPKTAEPDVDALRRAAKEDSRSAAAHLQRAGQEADRVPIGTLTWTGEVGRRPGVGGRRRGAPSSAGVMNRLADRQGLNNATGGAAGSSGSRNMKAEDFMPMIRTFITRQGGKAVTKMLVDHFGPYCQGEKQNDEFRKALETVAEITQRGSYGRSMWSLKKKMMKATTT
ncbi:DNA excision repair protein ERCC-6 [Geosmithia morbida]|uniref:DNA excision repair protein ERCC-6 n=1 Tax=Geosmithia morbida TaxID=1094350 RepID=A0A9P5D201_9HYPO|nr:DNA excision repair protein ERCC-6 [Geosmithia morbida]KAF4120320.1 DNA excision repair protein ERCC-6 [Geosmithia morbida]